MTGKNLLLSFKNQDIAIQTQENIFFKSDGPTLGTPKGTVSYNFFRERYFRKKPSVIRNSRGCRLWTPRVSSIKACTPLRVLSKYTSHTPGYLDPFLSTVFQGVRYMLLTSKTIFKRDPY